MRKGLSICSALFIGEAKAPGQLHGLQWRANGLQRCADRLRPPWRYCAFSGADTPLSGADTPLSGADTPLSGADTPLSGADTPLSGADTPLSGADTPLSGVLATLLTSGLVTIAFLLAARLLIRDFFWMDIACSFLFFDCLRMPCYIAQRLPNLLLPKVIGIS
jgi:hypothetical protein